MITNKLSNTMLIRSAEYFERNFTQAKGTVLCFQRQKIPKGYAIHFNDRNIPILKMKLERSTYYVTKAIRSCGPILRTKEAALEMGAGTYQRQEQNGKIRFVPPKLAPCGPDYRNGVEIPGQHYLDTFGFRGGEFGNWMNQNDRQTSPITWDLKH